MAHPIAAELMVDAARARQTPNEAISTIFDPCQILASAL
jgi:hypothetical protein